MGQDAWERSQGRQSSPSVDVLTCSLLPRASPQRLGIEEGAWHRGTQED